MTLTIELTPEEEARLAAAAQIERLEPAAYIRKLINGLPSPMRMDIAPSQGFGTCEMSDHTHKVATLDQVIQLLRSVTS